MASRLLEKSAGSTWEPHLTVLLEETAVIVEAIQKTQIRVRRRKIWNLIIPWFVTQ